MDEQEELKKLFESAGTTDTGTEDLGALFESGTPVQTPATAKEIGVGALPGGEMRYKPPTGATPNLPVPPNAPMVVEPGAGELSKWAVRTPFSRQPTEAREETPWGKAAALGGFNGVTLGAGARVHGAMRAGDQAITNYALNPLLKFLGRQPYEEVPVGDAYEREKQRFAGDYQQAAEDRPLTVAATETAGELLPIIGSLGTGTGLRAGFAAGGLKGALKAAATKAAKGAAVAGASQYLGSEHDLDSPEAVKAGLKGGAIGGVLAPIATAAPVATGLGLGTYNLATAETDKDRIKAALQLALAGAAGGRKIRQKVAKNFRNQASDIKTEIATAEQDKVARQNKNIEARNQFGEQRTAELNDRIEATNRQRQTDYEALVAKLLKEHAEKQAATKAQLEAQDLANRKAVPATADKMLQQLADRERAKYADTDYPLEEPGGTTKMRVTPNRAISPETPPFEPVPTVDPLLESGWVDRSGGPKLPLPPQQRPMVAPPKPRAPKIADPVGAVEHARSVGATELERQGATRRLVQLLLTRAPGPLKYGYLAKEALRPSKSGHAGIDLVKAEQRAAAASKKLPIPFLSANSAATQAQVSQLTEDDLQKLYDWMKSLKR